jgi:hypothetical protein
MLQTIGCTFGPLYQSLLKSGSELGTVRRNYGLVILVHAT